jgi:hypothetical protein
MRAGSMRCDDSEPDDALRTGAFDPAELAKSGSVTAPTDFEVMKSPALSYTKPA